MLTFLCSSCYKVMPAEEMCALPWWNAGYGAFYMAQRCPSCFEKSLAETTARVAQWDEEAETAFCSFLEIWKVLLHFPELQGVSTQETAKNVVRLVRESRRKALVRLALGMA